MSIPKATSYAARLTLLVASPFTNRVSAPSLVEAAARMYNGCMDAELLFDRGIYESFFYKELPLAEEYVWIATANVKNLRFPFGKRYRSVTHLFEKLVGRGVNIRLLASRDPSGSFDAELDRRTTLRTSKGFEVLICPRNHAKIVVIDGRVAYMGSANFTGAGLGAKGKRTRNFEAGIVTRDSELVRSLADYFDSIWMGSHCSHCGLKRVCPAPII